MAILAPTDDQSLLADEIRKRQLLQTMPGMNGQDPNVPPDQALNPQGAPIAPPPQAPVATPPPAPQSPVTMAPPPPSPYQQQIDAINKQVEAMGQTGEALSTLKGQAPTPSQYHVSKLRAALLMPLQILAGAGGQDTSKEFGTLIRPGLKTAMSDYQKRLDATQTKYDTMRQAIKDRLDVLKEEGTIDKDQAEAAYRKADIEFKKQELPLRKQEADTAKANIPPLNQALEAIRLKNNGQLTPDDINKEVQDYWTAQEKSRMDAEIAKYKMEKAARDEEKKTARQESNIAVDISKEQGRLNDILKPLETARTSIGNLKAMRAENNDDGFARLLTVIMADNALANVSHGSVRQNIGIIQELIKSPGWLEWLKGKAQGILVPGKGSISEATMKQIDRLLDTTSRQLDAEVNSAKKNLIDLNMLDPTDTEARGKLAKIIDNSYEIPQPTPPPKPPESDKPKGPWGRIEPPPQAQAKKNKRLGAMTDKELDDAIEAAKKNQ